MIYPQRKQVKTTRNRADAPSNGPVLSHRPATCSCAVLRPGKAGLSLQTPSVDPSRVIKRPSGHFSFSAAGFCFRVPFDILHFVSHALDSPAKHTHFFMFKSSRCPNIKRSITAVNGTQNRRFVHNYKSRSIGQKQPRQ